MKKKKRAGRPKMYQHEARIHVRMEQTLYDRLTAKAEALGVTASVFMAHAAEVGAKHMPEIRKLLARTPGTSPSHAPRNGRLA